MSSYEDRLPFRRERMWILSARRPGRIRELERKLGMTQADAVNHFIEQTCWANELPDFVGHRGTPEERLKALRQAISKLVDNEYGEAMREPN